MQGIQVIFFAAMVDKYKHKVIYINQGGGKDNKGGCNGLNKDFVCIYTLFEADIYFIESY